MATVKQIIERAYTKVNGEFEAVVESSDDFKTYLNVMNQVLENWAQTPYVKWQSLFNMNYTLPTVVAANQLIYPVPEADSIHIGNTPFDGVYFIDDEGVLVTKYKMVDQAVFDASKLPGMAALVSDGLHLKALSESMIGSSIRLPVYVDPPTYLNATDTVRIDSVPWLVTSMAAFICDASPVPFIARNAEKFYKEAAIYMKTMRDDNRHRQYLTIKSVTNAGATGSPTVENLVSLMGASGILGVGGGGGVIDGGSA